ncbi:SDR family NAD(P)-dependent oxidoreductase [bacterium]|nr:SDR family NAD(P)-dependent oxidoreductase [bacterium]
MKKVLVTGASAGIGRATAKLFAERGYQVLAVARRIEKLESLRAERSSVEIASVDLSSETAIEAFYETHKDWLKNVDVLVNNAGLALGRESFQEYLWSDVEKMFQTNVMGLLSLIRKIVPNMIAQKRGHLINIGSVAGDVGYKGGTVYCATKAAVHMIAESLRFDLGGTNVRVSNIAPGRVETDFSVVRFKGDKEAADKVYEGYRPLKSEDLANTILWIAEQPEHVNIQNVTILGTDQPSATTLDPFKG